MDPVYSLQDVIRCHLCEIPLPSKRCDICHVHLCEACEENHLSDEYKEHMMVPFNMRGLTPKCLKHSTKLCEVHCEYCDVAICEECVSSGEHEQHEKETFLISFSRKKERVQGDLQELKTLIYPSFQEVASNIQNQRVNVSKHSKKLKKSLNNKAEILHREIDSIIHKMQADIDVMTSEHLAAKDKEETAINETMKEISHVILEVQSLLDTNDVHLFSKYQSRNHKFKTLPTQLQVTLPSFSPMENDREQISKQIGSLSKLAITWQPISTAFLEKPRILANINIRRAFSRFNTLNGVCCISDSKFWTCQYSEKLMSVYNLQGEVVKTIKSKSWRAPHKIAVTRSGDLVYTGYSFRSINLVHGTKIQTLIRLRGWRTLNVCCTSVGDLLVLMYMYRKEASRYETKVVRYSGSTVKQIIQWDAQSKPLYACIKDGYLTENRNLDICVVDCDANAVVVVNAVGQFRFKYFGYPYSMKGSFKPAGITTDSRANILTADWQNHRIHIVDQDGYFLRYIDNCGLQCPWDISTDKSDNLFIAENSKFKVKKIQYYK